RMPASIGKPFPKRIILTRAPHLRDPRKPQSPMLLRSLYRTTEPLYSYLFSCLAKASRRLRLPRRAEINQQHRQISRADATNAAGLTQAGWADPREFLPGLRAQLRHGREVEVGWDRLRLQALKTLNLDGLA